MNEAVANANTELINRLDAQLQRLARVAKAADRWEKARAQVALLGATELDEARFHDAAEELARATRVWRKKA